MNLAKYFLLATFSHLIFLSCDCVFCQSYFKLVDTTSVWFTSRGTSDLGGTYEGTTYKYYLDADTIIDSNNYKKLDCYSQHHESEAVMGGGYITVYYPASILPSTKGYIREDTINKKIYFREPGDTSEVLLYDFDITIGDTVINWFYEFTETINIVSSIDSVEICGEYRKRFHISDSDNPGNPHTNIIEGIGAVTGLLDGISPFFESSASLLCFTNNDCTTVFPHEEDPAPYSPDFNCDFVYVGIEEFENVSFNIYPNPASSILNIKINKSGSDKLFIKIYSLSGQEVVNEFKINNNLISVSINNLPSGIYTLYIFDEEYPNTYQFIKN